ncbi:MAG TPA: PAS domain S-box protein, partial [Bacteroidales bacterium]|nr:PAS domain S-box protein [Bacteroidales bacterium]
MHTTSSIGIFTTDTGFTITSWNDWLERATGLTEESVIGCKISELIPDIEERGILEKFNKVATEGSTELLTPVFHHYLISIPLANPAGKFTEMQQRVTISPLADEEIIHGILVTIEDMTDHVSTEHEDSFRKRIDELSSDDWMKRRDVAVSLSTAG